MLKLKALEQINEIADPKLKEVQSTRADPTLKPKQVLGLISHMNELFLFEKKVPY